jgi:membrane-associated phospholipid phosphatase
VQRHEEANVTGPRPESAGESAVTVDPPLVTSAPPVLSRATAAIVSAAAGPTFALLTTWVARQGPAVPRADEHIHSWVISRRGPGSVTFARAVTWGGVTTVALPAVVLAGAVAARRDIKRRLESGLLLVCVAGAGVYVEARINAFAGRGRPPVADWAGAAGGSAFPSGHTTTATLFAALGAWAIAARVGRPRVFRTAELVLFHAASCRFRYSSWTSCGVR